MRAEERHEMRESDLSAGLQHGAWAFLKQNGSYILLVAALCFLGYTLYQRHLQTIENDRLSAYDALNSAINDESAITNPSAWAAQLRVDTALSAPDLESSAKTDMDVGLFQQAAAKYRAALQKYAEAGSKASNPTEQRTAQVNLERVNQQTQELLQKQTQHVLATLQSFVDTSPFKPVQARAALELGRLYSEIAAKRDFSTASRPENLSKSYQYYAKALELQGDDPLIAAKAHLGIAGVYEDQGEWDKAKAEYQTVISGPQFTGPLADLAKDRLATMDDRRNAPRLAMWTKPAAPAPAAEINGLNVPSLNLSTPVVMPSASPTSPSPSPFTIGPMLGTPSSLSGTASPSTAPTLPLSLPEPTTQPK